MPAIPIQDAIEQLALRVEQSELRDLVEIFAELFPAKPLTEAKTSSAGVLGRKLSQYVREKIEPEEAADLWNVVFPDGPNFYYDEEERALRQTDRGLRYAGS